jgi:hypothetical protein
MSDDGIKKCLWCGDEFKQPKPPKAEQFYCCYLCHIAAQRGPGI